MTSQIEYEYSGWSFQCHDQRETQSANNVLDGQNPRRSTNRVSNGTGKPYKIIMENVTEEKKPLNVQVTAYRMTPDIRY